MSVTIRSNPKKKNIVINYPEFCYVVLADKPIGERIGIVKAYQKGYTITDKDKSPTTIKEVGQAVEELNTELGISSSMSHAMKIGSWASWSCPGANPENWIKLASSRKKYKL